MEREYVEDFPHVHQSIGSVPETSLRMLPDGHTLRPLVTMARALPVMNRTNTLVNVREILDMLALH